MICPKLTHLMQQKFCIMLQNSSNQILENCQGISIKPPNLNDLSIANCKDLIPESLYNLLHLIITNLRNESTDDELSSSKCSNMADERRVLAIVHPPITRSRRRNMSALQWQDIICSSSHDQIITGAFIEAAGDNNDLNEETLDGKKTTHATTVVLYQQGQFGPLPERLPCADHSS